MKKLLLLGWLLLSQTVWSQTLGETVQRIHDQSAAMQSRAAAETDTWGEKTASEDLQQLRQSATSLLQGLEGDDARDVISTQSLLRTAASRVRASSGLLPQGDSERAAVEELLGLSKAVDERLNGLRGRFAEKASRVPGRLADQPLQAAEPSPFELYENPRQLLIDVRDARQLASSLQSGRFPPFGYGPSEPNNLDSVQVQRLVRAGWALQRGAEGNFEDVSQLYPLWERFRAEYDRLGYPGSNHVTRQLEKVVQRLDAFFQATAQP